MSDRLKRRLIAGAVEDNVRAIRNQPRGRLYRRRPFPWASTLSLAALGLAAVGAVYVLRLPDPAFDSVPPAPTAEAGRRARPAARPGRDVPVTLSAPPVRMSGAVFPVAVRKVVLDPGHGGGDLGTRTPTGLNEKELTLDLAQRVAALLRGAGFDPVLTREDDRRLLLDERVRIANEAAADLFVSIHFNWFQDGRANRGIETFYLGPTDDPTVTALASQENRESGYSLSDVRRLLDSIYADLRQEQSRALAAEVQRKLLRSVREVAPEVRDRGVKSAPFLVLVTTQMPAILAEVACLSNREEAELLGRAEYRDRIARALFDGIAAYSRVVAQAEPAEDRGREVR